MARNTSSLFDYDGTQKAMGVEFADLVIKNLQEFDSYEGGCDNSISTPQNKECLLKDVDSSYKEYVNGTDYESYMSDLVKLASEFGLGTMVSNISYPVEVFDFEGNNIKSTGEFIYPIRPFLVDNVVNIKRYSKLGDVTSNFVKSLVAFLNKNKLEGSIIKSAEFHGLSLLIGGDGSSYLVAKTTFYYENGCDFPEYENVFNFDLEAFKNGIISASGLEYLEYFPCEDEDAGEDCYSAKYVFNTEEVAYLFSVMFHIYHSAIGVYDGVVFDRFVLDFGHGRNIGGITIFNNGCVSYSESEGYRVVLGDFDYHIKNSESRVPYICEYNCFCKCDSIYNF